MVAKLYFDPPLWLQRQAWVLSKLRQERSDSVVDVGCSNGVLLSALMQPAFQLDSFPVHRFPALALHQSDPSSSSQQEDDHDRNLLSKRHWIYSPNDIVLSRLIGIDVERKALENAKSSLSLHGIALSKNRPRWKSLDVRLFHGPVETENETLDDYDAFVATEVIEHLEETALQRFAPTVFGKYRPRIVLITTPNYCFNDNFGTNLETRPGFPDPTGRTHRVFRHEDHKFEFTPEEFRKWCDSIADDYGYEVKIQGVGAGIYRVPKAEMDPPPPTDQPASVWKASRPRTTSHADERLRHASQAAMFVRHSASRTTAERYHDTSSGMGRQDSSHPFSDQFVKNAVPKPLVDTRVHDMFDEAVSGEGDENDDDERGRSGRRARSRKPENLPFLSSPSPQTPLAPSFQGQVAADQLGLSVYAAIDPHQSAPMTPFTGHQLIWSHRFPCSLEDMQISESGKRKIQTALPLPADEIMSQIVEKQRQLYVDAQWKGDDGATREDMIGREAIAKLWDVWSDDHIRAACGGRISLLLDALRLVATESAALPSALATETVTEKDTADSTLSASGLPTGLEEGQLGNVREGSQLCHSVIVGSDGLHWELRVQTIHHSNPSSPNKEFVESELFLVYSHPDVGRWQTSIDEARNWVPKEHFSSARWNLPQSTAAAVASSGTPVGGGDHGKNGSSNNGGNFGAISASTFAVKAPSNAASRIPSWD